MNTKDKRSLEAKYGRMTLAKFLRAYRLTEELSQTELAQQLGWSKGNICDIENGRRVIGTDRAKVLSEVTDIPLDYILEIILNQQLKEAGIKKYVKVEFDRKKNLKAEIDEKLEIIKKVLNGLGYYELILFGSRARGNNRSDSDYDILVILDKDVSKSEKIALSTLIRKKIAQNNIDADVLLKSKREIDFIDEKAPSVTSKALKEGIRL